MFRKPERSPDDDVVRPSTFREDPSERTHMYPGPEPDYPTAEDKDAEELGFDPPEERAVAVYLVSPPPNDRSFVEWSSMTVGVGTKAVQVASYDRRRKRLRVKNLDATNAVVVCRNATDLLHTGYTINAGETEEFLHNSGVWLRTGEGVSDQVQISVYSEFELDEYEDGERD